MSSCIIIRRVLGGGTRFPVTREETVLKNILILVFLMPGLVLYADENPSEPQQSHLGSMPAIAAPRRPVAETQQSSYRLTEWDGVLDKAFDVSKSEWWYTIGFLNGTNQNGENRRLAVMVNVVRGADLYTKPLFI